MGQSDTEDFVEPFIHMNMVGTWQETKVKQTIKIQSMEPIVWNYMIPSPRPTNDSKHFNKSCLGYQIQESLQLLWLYDRLRASNNNVNEFLKKKIPSAFPHWKNCSQFRGEICSHILITNLHVFSSQGSVLKAIPCVTKILNICVGILYGTILFVRFLLCFWQNVRFFKKQRPVDIFICKITPGLLRWKMRGYYHDSCTRYFSTGYIFPTANQWIKKYLKHMP